MAVEASACGRGIGKRLMLELMDLATTPRLASFLPPSARQVRAVALHVSAGYVVAAALYRSFGFEPFATMKAAGSSC